MRRFERCLLWGSAVAVGASGAVLGVMKYLMTSEDPYAVVHHPLQPLILKIHIVAAPLLVFAVGVVFTEHIWQQWRSGPGRGRGSGLSMLFTVVPMVLSGYLIQTVTDERWLSAMIVAHIVTGSIYLAGFLSHQLVLGLRLRKVRQAGANGTSTRKGRASRAA